MSRTGARSAGTACRHSRGAILSASCAWRCRAVCHDAARIIERAAAQPIRQRLRELRQREKVATDEHERFWLSRRKLVLGQMLQQMNELADLTEHYYERSYWRDEKYRL